MPPHEIHWEVTNRCNLRCLHCLPASGEPRPNELTTDEALAAIRRFADDGVQRVYLTGGEPFMRPDIRELLLAMSQRGLKIEIITNGLALTGRDYDLVQALGVRFGISLDGADAATNDAIRGRGTFDRTVQTLALCAVQRIPVVLYVTVTRGNFEQLSALGHLAKTYDCQGIHFSELTMAGRAIDNADLLGLTADQQRQLPRVIAAVARDVFNEELSSADDACSIDGASLFMSADGNLYTCSEVLSRRPDLAIGNIRTLTGWPTIATQHHLRCCYGVQASPHVSFIGNLPGPCAGAPISPAPITTLEQLSDALDGLYPNIAADCNECQDPDCLGYVWVLEREVERLADRGVPLVQINRGPTFINSFPLTADGRPDVSVRAPACSQLCTDSRRCRIHDDRPLVCRLYPLGLETRSDGVVEWVLHTDCLFVRRLTERGQLSTFERQARQIIDRLTPELHKEIVGTYCAVDAISAFPDGGNSYRPLKEVPHVKV